MSEVIVTPLGTVSPYPKGDMNCPGFLVESGPCKILLDCGNGVTRYLNFPNGLKDLNVILSHYHKDHIGDIGSIQYASFCYHNLGLLDDKVKVFLPKHDFGHNRESILSNDESYCEYFDMSDVGVGDFSVSFHDNRSHTINSYMTKLDNGEVKIVYTSDIGMSNYGDLVRFCRDADLLICESSFLRKHNSSSKTHMRACDAGRLAKDSGVGELLLTHFWPEEDKNLYLEEALEIFPNSSVAEEGKKIKVLSRGYGK